MGILGHMAMAEVGFCGVVVRLWECILGRSGENEVVGGFGWSGGGFGGAEVDLGGAEVVSRTVRVDNLGQLRPRLGTHPFA